MCASSAKRKKEDQPEEADEAEMMSTEDSGDKDDILSTDHNETTSSLTIGDKIRHIVEGSLVVVMGIILVGPERASAALEGTLMLGR